MQVFSVLVGQTVFTTHQWEGATLHQCQVECGADMRMKTRTDQIPYLGAWRRHAQLTQEQLGLRARIAANSIRRIEAGYPARQMTTAKLAEALGISVQQLRTVDPAALPPTRPRSSTATATTSIRTHADTDVPGGALVPPRPLQQQTLTVFDRPVRIVLLADGRVGIVAADLLRAVDMRVEPMLRQLREDPFLRDQVIRAEILTGDQLTMGADVIVAWATPLWLSSIPAIRVPSDKLPLLQAILSSIADAAYGHFLRALIPATQAVDGA